MVFMIYSRKGGSVGRGETAMAGEMVTQARNHPLLYHRNRASTNAMGTCARRYTCRRVGAAEGRTRPGPEGQRLTSFYGQAVSGLSPPPRENRVVRLAKRSEIGKNIFFSRNLATQTSGKRRGRRRGGY